MMQHGRYDFHRSFLFNSLTLDLSSHILSFWLTVVQMNVTQEHVHMTCMQNWAIHYIEIGKIALHFPHINSFEPCKNFLYIQIAWIIDFIIRIKYPLRNKMDSILMQSDNSIYDA